MKKPKVIILCGGKGRRLRPLTKSIPKPLIYLNGKPLLQHIIESYQKQNLNDFILCTGYRSQDIEAFIENSKFKAEIEISNLGEDASMLERLYQVRHLIDERAIVTYGDTYTDLDAQNLLNFHLKKEAMLTIITAEIQSPFGIITQNPEGKLTSFNEKPVFSYYIGSFLVEKKVLDFIPPELLKEEDGNGLVRFFKMLIQKNNICAYSHSGLQLTFNTADEHRKAETHFMKFFTDSERVYGLF